MRPSQGFWGGGEKAYFIFREQGEIAIILMEPGSKLLILGSWGALSKMYMIWLLPPPPHTHTQDPDEGNI